VPPKSLILFEDLDCMRTGNARPDADARASSVTGANENAVAHRGVTLSGLLNVLDGFSEPENMLFVMTTSSIEVLDRALLRPGRIDYRLYFGDVAAEQKIELYKRFFPEGSESEARWFADTHDSAETMAEFQGFTARLG
jgi:chaperone BCS1